MALRATDDRVRRLLVTLAIFSTFVIASEWKRVAYEEEDRQLISLERRVNSIVTTDPVITNLLIEVMSDGRFRSRSEFEAYTASRRLDDDRQAAVVIPGVGVTIDVGNVLLFTGAGNVSLLLLLYFALAQGRQDLFLALFALRQFHDVQVGPTVDTSDRTNHEYNALAMTQVIVSPPTLAYWRRSRVKPLLISAALLSPVILQVLIGYSVLRWRSAAMFDGPLSAWSATIALAGGLLALAITTIQHYQASNRAWTETFFYINPQLHLVRASTISFVRNRMSVNHGALRRALAGQAISRLRLTHELSSFRITATYALTLSDHLIGPTDILEMCNGLELAAVRNAERPYSRLMIVAAYVRSSNVQEDAWEVVADFVLQSAE